MQTVVDAAFQIALYLCKKLPKYQTFIAIENRNKYDAFISYLSYSYPCRTCSVLKSKNECTFKFDNGSIIRVCVINENQRGRRANCILYDNEIKDEIVNNIIRPMAVRYYKFGDMLTCSNMVMSCSFSSYDVKE